MRGLVALLLMGCCSLASAAEWTVVHAGEGNQYFYDASKLTVNANEITYWKKVLFKTPQLYKDQQAVSALYRERINCAEHTVKPLSHIVRGANGMVIEQVTGEGDTTAIIPETIGDLFEAALCPQVKSKPADSKPPEKPETKPETKPEAPAPILEQDLPPGTL